MFGFKEHSASKQIAERGEWNETAKGAAPLPEEQHRWVLATGSATRKREAVRHVEGSPRRVAAPGLPDDPPAAQYGTLQLTTAAEVQQCNECVHLCPCEAIGDDGDLRDWAKPPDTGCVPANRLHPPKVTDGKMG